MNIFYLDSSHEWAAKFYVNAHVVKIITEINQCLSNSYPCGIAPYKHAYNNHPISKWCGESIENFNWAIEHGLALCDEYYYRYGQYKNKQHAGRNYLEWFKSNPPQTLILKSKTINTGKTPFPQCFGKFREQCYIKDNPIEAYRNYYRIAKRHLHKWKDRDIPYWIENSKINLDK